MRHDGAFCMYCFTSLICTEYHRAVSIGSFLPPAHSSPFRKENHSVRSALIRDTTLHANRLSSKSKAARLRYSSPGYIVWMHLTQGEAVRLRDSLPVVFFFYKKRERKKKEKEKEEKNASQP